MGNQITDFFSHRVDPSEIKAGDHLYSWRTGFLFSHQGIYVGEKMIINFGPNDPEKVPSFLSSSSKSHTALCLNSHDSGSSLSTCSHCTSWNPNIPASCLSLPHCGYRQPNSGVTIVCLNCFIETGSLYRYQYGVGFLSGVFKLRVGTWTCAKSDPPEEVIKRAVYLLRHGFGSYDTLRNNCEYFALYCKTGLMIRNVDIGSGSGQASIFSNIGNGNQFSIPCLQTDIGVRDDAEKVALEQVVEYRRRNM